MKAKKLLALVLAVIMALGCMSVTAFAGDEPTTTTIKYLEPTYKTADIPSSGLSGWTVVEKKDVKTTTEAASATDFGAGGWFAVTSNLNVSSEVFLKNDLNLYIAKKCYIEFWR